MPSKITLPETSRCHFCDEIERGPKGLIAESRQCLILVNPRQHAPGQLVVITRRHVPLFLDISDAEAEEAIRMAKQAASALREVYEIDGILIYQNNGVASGQEVPHYHLHVVLQRFATSRWGQEPPHVADTLGREFQPHEPKWLEDDERDRIAARVCSYFGP